MANVLLAWELGSGAGHCTKLAVLAKGLVNYGHVVCVASRELTTARRLFGTNGIRFFQAPILTVRPVNAIPLTRSLAHILHNNGFAESATLDALCSAWRSIFAAVSPDLLICDHAPVALLASHWHATRRVLVGTGFTVPPIVTPFPDLRYWNPSVEMDCLRRDEEILCSRINDLFATDGISPLENLAQLYAEVDDGFLLTFRELDHYPLRNGAKYWGAWSAAGGGTPGWPAGRHRIFAYLKPPAANWPLGHFLSALRESRLPTIAYVADCDSHWIAKFQSTQLRITSSPLDMSQVVQECDLAILHGNAGSATALLLAGIPQLNLPLFLEQLVLSRRIAELGAGMYADPARPDVAIECLHQMLAVDGYRDAAQKFSRRYSTFDQQQTAKEIVHKVHELLSI